MKEKWLLKEINKRIKDSRYNYLFLKAMLKRAEELRGKNLSIVVGSSYALKGIEPAIWPGMVSFGMHSQVLYYSLKFIQTANIENKFSKIYLILGYYAPYLDLSLQTTERKTYIGGAYYSLFLDSHHWKDPFQTKTWHWSILYPSCIKEYCEKCFISYLKNVNSYYNNFRCRLDKEQFNGRKWAELPEKERIIIAKNRVEQHSRFKKYKTTFLENTDLLNKFYEEDKSRKRSI